MQIVGQNFNSKYLKIVIVLIFLVLVIIPLLLQLDSFSIRIWDESRMAHNALEMYQNHKWWVLYFDGQPDMWNTKPPLVAWIHVLMFNIFGIHDLSLRLPSALAGLATILFIACFIYRRYKELSWSILSGIVLVTSLGYVRQHGTRTCEFDAILAFFTTGYVIFFWLYLNDQKRRDWLGFTVCLIFACFTKGIGGFLFVPALFFSTFIFTTQFYRTANWKYYLSAVLVFCLIIFGYYFFRETQTPGYLEAVYQNELGGRYLETTEGHEGSVLYYLKNMNTRFYVYWFPFMLIALISGFFYSDKSEKRLHQFLSLNILVYLLIISLGRSKLEWYDLPLYPLIAILIGLFLKNILELSFYLNIQKKFSNVWILPVLLMLLLLYKPYRQLIEDINATSRNDHQNYYTNLAFYLKEAYDENRPLKDHYVVDYGYVPNVSYYVDILNLKGNNIRFKEHEAIQPGDIIITRMGLSKDYIEAHFNYKLLDEKAWVKVYQIESGKK